MITIILIVVMTMFAGCSTVEWDIAGSANSRDYSRDEKITHTPEAHETPPQQTDL